MTDPIYPSVTVVLVVTGTVDAEEPTEVDLMNPDLTEASKASVHAAERQQYLGEWHLNIVQNVDGHPIAALQALGVQYADTEWVALMEEGDTWPPDMLSRLVHDAAMEPVTGSHAVSPLGHLTTLVRRKVYLDQNGI